MAPLGSFIFLVNVLISVLPSIVSANIALGKPTAQTDTLNFAGYDWSSDLAVDGCKPPMPDNDYENSQCCSGSFAVDNYNEWTVDLLGQYVLDYIVVYGRSDVPQQLEGFTLFIKENQAAAEIPVYDNIGVPFENGTFVIPVLYSGSVSIVTVRRITGPLVKTFRMCLILFSFMLVDTTTISTMAEPPAPTTEEPATQTTTVIPSPPVPMSANIALGKPTAQTDTLNFAGYDWSSDLAVDGCKPPMPDNDYENSQCCSGSFAVDNYNEWTVDLLGQYVLDYIVVYGRSDVPQQLEGFTLFIKENQAAAEIPVYDNIGVPFENGTFVIPVLYSGSVSIVTVRRITGPLVKTFRMCLILFSFMLVDTTTISTMAEPPAPTTEEPATQTTTVIPSPPVPRENIALNKPAFQLEDLFYNFWWFAYLAVDGCYERTDPNNVQCCSTSLGNFGNYWRVELGQLFVIDHVIIYGRADQSDQLPGFLLFTQEIDAGPEALVFDSTGIPYGEGVYDIPIDPPMVAKNVIVRRDGIITLCEVDVFGSLLTTTTELTTTTGVTSTITTEVSSTTTDIPSTTTEVPSTTTDIPSTTTETSSATTDELSTTTTVPSTTTTIFSTTTQELSTTTAVEPSAPTTTSTTEKTFVSTFSTMAVPPSPTTEELVSTTSQAPSPPVPRENIAFNKPAFQLEDLFYNFWWFAYLAVDGCYERTDPNNVQCCSTSLGNFGNYWRVELGQLYVIDHVIIYGRADQNDQLPGFLLFTQELNAGPEALVFDSTGIPYGEGVYDIPIDPPVIARNVIIRRDGIITLCEVDVFGMELTTTSASTTTGELTTTPHPTTSTTKATAEPTTSTLTSTISTPENSNIALGKPTTQTNTLNFAGYDWSSDLAVDGCKPPIPDNDYENSQCCSGSFAVDNYNEWTVDLLGQYVLDYIVVYGRSEESIALNKPAFQLEDLFFNFWWFAYLAVDGCYERTDPNNVQCCSTSLGNFGNYWRVELGQLYVIDHVIIYGRADQSDQLPGFLLFTQELDAGPEVLVYDSTGMPYGEGVYDIPIDPPVLASNVIVRRDGIITLCEVDVFGIPYILPETPSTTESMTTVTSFGELTSSTEGSTITLDVSTTTQMEISTSKEPPSETTVTSLIEPSTMAASFTSTTQSPSTTTVSPIDLSTTNVDITTAQFPSSTTSAISTSVTPITTTPGLNTITTTTISTAGELSTTMSVPVTTSLPANTGGVNIATFQSASQRKDLLYSGFLWTADKAIDGCNDRSVPEVSRCCSSSEEVDLGDNFWRVDFNETFPIMRIIVNGREDFGFQLDDFMVYINDTLGPPVYDAGGIAFTDGVYDIVLEPEIQTNSIIIKRPVGAAYFYITLCEVEAITACTDGYYGYQCENTCGNCLNSEACYKITGTCPNGCTTGYQGTQCITTCSLGNYGENCQEFCGNCAFNASCDIFTGQCPSDCEAGWKDGLCKTPCEDGTYGSNCLMNCGMCALGTTCNPITGICESGCAPGWLGEMCNTTCDDGFYGNNCTNECGNCFANIICDKETGQCPGDCASGWQGLLCDQVCDDGYHGVNCNQSCGNCLGGLFCEKITGDCPAGCDPGFTGSDCKQECANGTYGFSCMETCGNCIDGEACNKVSGVCENGCGPGFRDALCITECNAGTYGSNCINSCGACADNDTCDTITGICPNECQPGWLLDTCDLECPDGMYGINCSETCGNCLNGDVCTKTTGTCENGCNPGYQDLLCKTVCDEGTYGSNCSNSCGFCANNVTCDAISGVCPNECQPGWLLNTCDLECPDGLYGINCSQTCGNCLNGDVCIKTTGVCENGCNPGYQGLLCKTECDAGTYGSNCSNSCGACADNVTCDAVSGACPNECQPGWLLETCNLECPDGMYGINCSEPCGNCLNGDICIKTTGMCENGCNPGYQGLLCKTDCDNGTYGLNCSSSCGNCDFGVNCDRFNGTCPGGCEPGWQTDTCDLECPPGTYGYNCLVSCGNCEFGAACDTVTGVCPGNCEPGWTGLNCDQVVTTTTLQTTTEDPWNKASSMTMSSKLLLLSSIVWILISYV
ncbi:hypothetical protein ACF0H5_012489 [Mactra antiquata]